MLQVTFTWGDETETDVDDADNQSDNSFITVNFFNYLKFGTYVFPEMLYVINAYRGEASFNGTGMKCDFLSFKVFFFKAI